MLRRLAAQLPDWVQHHLRVLWYRRMIRTGRFASDEPEFARLGEWAGPGDWVIDVGANVGAFTRRLSELVGPDGRVIAFEPIPETFALLAGNTSDLSNVTLIQAAASSGFGVLCMSMPRLPTGLAAHYQASVSNAGAFSVLAMPLSGLQTPPIALVKIDAEGHDLEVLRGLGNRPRAVIVEGGHGGPIAELLGELGYTRVGIESSPNTVWLHDG